MTAAEGAAAAATRAATRGPGRPAERSGIGVPRLRTGDEGGDDAVLIWNGTVAVVPELRHTVPAKQGIRRRG